MNKQEILIIDDEDQIRKLLEITLRNQGYKIVEASTAREGLAMAANHPPDLILLDIGLPDESGQEVLKKLREWYHKPVIILSVQNDEENIITALDNDANDYLTKPFRTGELLARIRSYLRNSGNEEENDEITAGHLTIDFKQRAVKKNNELVKLTATEYNLLCLLVKNEGRVLTHQYILTQVWGPGHADQSQSLRVFIANLRKKIENDYNNPELILTESRVGYRFVLPE
ncbi:MAG TPA: response regulator transcription factor [Bacteroidia bacterium]|jgi:two-component system KDP operon response regulator KdpE|nr:response regulator transcription factor [Bacteroidia bacterium]